MGRMRRNCPVFGCGSSNLAILSNHLAQVHNIGHWRTTKWLKWNKAGICVPLKDQDANKKKIHIANTLERLIKLQEEMATNTNIFKSITHLQKEKKVQRQYKGVDMLIETINKYLINHLCQSSVKILYRLVEK